MGSPPVPSVDISGGNFNEQQLVTISTNTTGSTIYFTTDGSTPTNENFDMVGNDSIQVLIDAEGTTELKFFATDIDGDSGVFTETYILDLPPTISAEPKGGFFNEAKDITLQTTAGSTIFFTLEGRTPTVSDFDGTGTTSVQVNISQEGQTVLKFFATDSGGTSEIITEIYILTFLGIPDYVSDQRIQDAINIALQDAARHADDFQDKVTAKINITIDELKDGKRNMRVDTNYEVEDGSNSHVNRTLQEPDKQKDQTSYNEDWDENTY